MKLRILIPSDEYRSYAGARIRYGRLRLALMELGIGLDLQDISTFAPERAECDVLLISKCHDARALVAAGAVSRRGCLVGVDLFDDYFSQLSDSRLVRFRTWLTQLLPICDFALCSTPTMADVTARYRPDLSVHVVNDPAKGTEFASLAEVLTQKLVRAVDERLIRLAWFGVGDNPYFTVGLTDLAAFGHLLEPLRHSEFDVELSVLTNSRALDAHGLASLAQLPVRANVEEWTLAREKAMLAEAFACFLPVNVQSFSLAKSLNRAVTALSAGCQVIAAGYPLYAPLESFIYTDPGSFVSDLARGLMRLSPGTMLNLDQAMKRVASPAKEANDLAQFLRSLKPSTQSNDLLVLIHAQARSKPADEIVRAAQGLSVGSPYCAIDQEFDVVFRGNGGELIMLVSQEAADRVRPEVRGRLRSMSRIGSRKFWRLSEDGETLANIDGAANGWERRTLAFKLATYRSAMKVLQKEIKEAFGPCRIILAENSSLPFVAAEELARSC